MSTIIQKYASDFGKIYVQVSLSGQVIEFGYAHDPSDAEIQASIDQFNLANTLPVATVEIMAEDGTIL